MGTVSIQYLAFWLLNTSKAISNNQPIENSSQRWTGHTANARHEQHSKTMKGWWWQSQWQGCVIFIPYLSTTMHAADLAQESSCTKSCGWCWCLWYRRTSYWYVRSTTTTVRYVYWALRSTGLYVCRNSTVIQTVQEAVQIHNNCRIVREYK